MKNKDKLIRIPISYKQRKMNEYGNGYVSCEVSERWIQLPEKISNENENVASQGKKQL